MMKHVALLCLFLSGMGLVKAQPKIKVIVSDKLQGYTMGDTIEVDGYRKTDFVGGSEYFLKKNNNEVKMIPAKKVAVVTQIQDFWSQLWFYNHSADYILNGIDQKVRTQLLTNCRYYIFNLQANKLIFQDDYLTDYLLQLIHTICPEGIFKGGNSGLNILIMKSDEPKSFSFDNGIIVVTTALLAGTKNEKDLVQILSGEIGKIILDYNYQNVQHEIRSQGLTDFLSLLADAASGTFNASNQDQNHLTLDNAIATSTSVNFLSNNLLESLGAIYNADQEKQFGTVVTAYMNLVYDKGIHKNQDEYNRYIAKIITLTAWQKFYSLKYKDAITFINRLENAGCAEENDYLLKAKLYRTLFNTEESNYEALRYIKTAKNLGVIPVLDLDKEEGLIYLRLNDKANAKIALEAYEKGLESQPVQTEDDNNEIQWVKDVLYKTNL